MKDEYQMSDIGVTAALGKLLRESPGDLEVVWEGIKHYLSEYTKAKAEGIDGPAIAQGFHVSMDELVDEARSHPDSGGVTCAKGCAHCCYIEVHVTADEAQLLIMVAKANGIEIDWEHVKHQAKAERWKQLDFKSRKCVFLDADNTCSVYEYRPSTCRKYLVGSPPDRCNSQKYPSGETSLLSVHRAEMMTSALFSACQSDTLPKQLLKQRGECE